MRVLVGPHTTAPSQRRHALGFSIWSEDGVVFMEHRQHGEITVLTQKEARQRADAFAEECDSWDKSRDHGSPDEKAFCREKYAAIKELCEVLYETLNDAKFQGDPNNEEIRRQKLREFLRKKNEGSGYSYMRSFLPAIGVPPTPRLIIPGG